MAAAVELSRHVVALEQCGAVDVLVSGELETGRGQVSCDWSRPQH